MKNDVYTYVPENTWCREGMAIETEAGRLLDTFWHLSPRDYMIDHYLSEDETKTAKIIANLDGFTPYKPYTSDPRNVAGFAGYTDADRLLITSQHGLTEHMYIRQGAEPNLENIIEKARADVSDALHKRDSAMHRVQSARDNLFFAENGVWPWEVTS